MSFVPGYQPKSSGMLRGGGSRRFSRKQQPSNLPYVKLSDHRGLRQMPDFDPAMSYTPYDLAMLAEKILLEDPKPPYEEPAYLPIPALAYRQRHEIYSSGRQIDPAYASGLYWRTHPNGLKWNNEAQRRATADSFYR